MTTDRINIIFIIIALVCAVVLPFELFLFSYAVLGPMHYLTEINWLKTKSYFLTSKIPIYFLFGVLAIISLMFAFRFVRINGIDNYINRYFNIVFTVLTLSSFIFVILLEFAVNRLKVWGCMIAGVLMSLVLLKLHSSFYILTYIYIPTLIHVYVFTLLFMIYGYKHNRERLTLIAVGLVLLTPIILYLLPSSVFDWFSLSSARVAYNQSGFASLNQSILGVLNLELNQVIGVKLQAFIAFAYTYHYLNWFAKTNVIGWSKSIGSTSLVLILLFWGIAVGLYLYDYNIGLMVLFVMSFMHVLLEFPLNAKSIKSLLYR